LSNHTLVALPKNLISSLPRAGSLAMLVSEALLFQQRVRARSGMGIDLEYSYNSLKRKEARKKKRMHVHAVKCN
jgi:hypothetical protein